MSDDDAYKIAKILYESQDKLAAIAKTFGRYNKAELGARPSVFPSIRAPSNTTVKRASGRANDPQRPPLTGGTPHG